MTDQNSGEKATQSLATAQAEPSPTELATIRTALALDRTLLAWIRTSLTLIAFGFTLARFVHDLIEKGALHMQGMQPHYPRELGLGLMGLGILTLIGGAFEYVRLAHKLYPHKTQSVWSVSLLVTIVLIVLSLFFTVELILDIKLQ